MTLYTSHVESIRNVTQLAGMIFQIHGGWVSGSAGCIDLTSNIDNFVALFEVLGNDLIIKVEY